MYIQIGAHVGTRRIFKLRDSAPDGRSHNRNRRPGDIRIAGVQRYFNVSAAVRLSACGSFLFHCRFLRAPENFCALLNDNQFQLKSICANGNKMELASLRY